MSNFARLTFGSMLVVLFASAAKAQIAEPPAEALDVMSRYDRAILQQDADALQQILSDDYVLIGWDGEELDKAQIIGEAEGGKFKLDVAKSENSVYRIYGDTLLWRGDWTESGTDDGEPFTKHGVFTTVLAKQDGVWKVISDQVTQRKQNPNIEGIWRMHARMDAQGRRTEVQPNEASSTILKFIPGGKWCVTYADANGGINFHHGGDYVLEENTYVENIGFASESTSNMLGSEFKFHVEVKGDSLIQKGINNSYNEVWRRVK
ncbi:MAG: nuclear transport factor 2 family protein [bacterium]|nr:nuclear transport factor 2 family protein [bacterium]